MASTANDNIHYLYAPPVPIAQFLRVGLSDHRKAEQLWSANKLLPRRFIFEAANMENQKPLLKTLHASGAETVLDTNAAELSSIGRYAGAVRGAPWALDDRPLAESEFTPNRNESVIGRMALFAIEHGFTSVMAPTHYLEDRQLDWLSIDTRACMSLRNELDRLDGRNVGIDYLLIISYKQLRDTEYRAKLLQRLRDLPIDRIFLKISGFGVDATGHGMTVYIEALREFHVLGIPVIADQIGGLASLAVASFGSISGFSHGLEGRQRFDGLGWLKVRSKGGGGGGKRLYLPQIDRGLTVTEIKEITNASKTARSLFGCRDASCCGSTDKMLRNPEAHFLVQKTSAVEEISRTPEKMRVDQILQTVDKRLKESGRAANLKVVSDPARNKMIEARSRLERVNDALEGHYERFGVRDAAPELKQRTITNASGKGGGS